VSPVFFFREPRFATAPRPDREKEREKESEKLSTFSLVKMSSARSSVSKRRIYKSPFIGKARVEASVDFSLGPSLRGRIPRRVIWIGVSLGSIAVKHRAKYEEA